MVHVCIGCFKSLLLNPRLPLYTSYCWEPPPYCRLPWLPVQDPGKTCCCCFWANARSPYNVLAMFEAPAPVTQALHWVHLKAHESKHARHTHESKLFINLPIYCFCSGPNPISLVNLSKNIVQWTLWIQNFCRICFLTNHGGCVKMYCMTLYKSSWLSLVTSEFHAFCGYIA